MGLSASIFLGDSFYLCNSELSKIHDFMHLCCGNSILTSKLYNLGDIIERTTELTSKS